MNPRGPDNQNERDLWRLYTRDRQSAHADDRAEQADGDLIDLNDLAAYLEDRTDHAATERIEQAMVRHPELLDTVIEARALLDQPPVLASSELVQRASALVSLNDPSDAPRPLLFPVWSSRLRLAAAAALALLVAGGGYLAGAGSAQPSQQQTVDSTDIVEELEPMPLEEDPFASTEFLLAMDTSIFGEGGEP